MMDSMERNILLTIEYDGTNFYGWQRQPDVRTVQGTLEDVLSKVCGRRVLIEGSGRTDAGVHALGQRATFCGDFGIPTERIAYAANNILSESMKDGDVRITKAEEVPKGFHARFDAVGKKYIYKIRNADFMPVFLRNYRYRVWRKLDLDAMKQATGFIVGTRDFACFQSAGATPKESTVRTVKSLNLKSAVQDLNYTGFTAFGTDNMEIADAGTDNTEIAGAGTDKTEIADAGTDNTEFAGAGTDKTAGTAGIDIDIEIIGDGFLYNMVRIIAGTLIDVGTGKIEPEFVQEIIRSKERGLAGFTAPPQGLYLAEVYYGRNRCDGI